MKNVGRFDLILQLGWTAALAVLVPLGLGLWLDSRFATSPLFILIGGMLGMLVATVGVVRVTVRTIDQVSEPNGTPIDQADRKEDEE